MTPEQAAALAKLTSSGREVDEIMEEANDILDGHGVEALQDNDGHAIAEYVNLGDTYDTTLLFDIEAQAFLITSWGDWFEAWEQEQEDEDDDCSHGADPFTDDDTEGEDE